MGDRGGRPRTTGSAPPLGVNSARQYSDLNDSVEAPGRCVEALRVKIALEMHG